MPPTTVITISTRMSYLYTNTYRNSSKHLDKNFMLFYSLLSILAWMILQSKKVLQVAKYFIVLLFIFAQPFILKLMKTILKATILALTSFSGMESPMVAASLIANQSSSTDTTLMANPMLHGEHNNAPYAGCPHHAIARLGELDHCRLYF